MNRNKNLTMAWNNKPVSESQISETRLIIKLIICELLKRSIPYMSAVYVIYVTLSEHSF